MREELKRIHPGFTAARSVVLHRSSTDENYAVWRQMLKGGSDSSGIAVAPGEFPVGTHSEIISTGADSPAGLIRISGAPILTRSKAEPTADQDESGAKASQDVPPAASAIIRRGIDFDFGAIDFGSPHEVSPTRRALGDMLIRLGNAIRGISFASHPALNVEATTFVEEADASEFDEAELREVAAAFESASPEPISQHIGHFQIVGSQRNTTALFGAGGIDSIPDAVLEAAAKQRFDEFPQVSGRVSRLKDGRIGRFGWKGQKATLRDFTMTACAVELGLHVSEHDQAGIPQKPDYKPAGFDLDRRECDALVAYLRALPAPKSKQPHSPQPTEYLESGKRLFTQIGCAACHTPNLGEVEGLYSDLLLHDMGLFLADGGDYGVFVPNSDASDEEMLVFPAEQRSAAKKLSREEQEREDAKAIGARQQEWRTPPLWGVRDSSPYLHDGRAPTLEAAIAMHDGEGRESRKRFARLTPAERLQLVSFLKSLSAP